MAKVIGPLFSIKARGQLGKTLVFFPWKSINAVRSYVIPANPNTADQQAQRAKMAAAVAEWHAAGYIAKDKTAWNKWASTLAGALSGFNAMVRSHIAAVIRGDTWMRISNCVESGIQAAQVTVTQDVTDTSHYILYWGTSPTFMPNSHDQTGDGSNVVHVMDNLVDGVIYYYWVDCSTAVKGGRTGVFKYKHVAP